MENAKFNYRELAPSIGLEPYIHSFWEFAVSGRSEVPTEYEVFPDGCSSLFYFRSPARQLHFVGISGIHVKSIKRPVFAGDTYSGMRISPAATAGLLRSDPSRILQLNTLDSSNEFPHLVEGLIEQLPLDCSLEEFVNVGECRILELINSGCSFDPLIMRAVELIKASPGTIRIDEIAETLGLSTRQFQRRFKASSGISPKYYLRTCRLRAAAVGLVEDSSQNLASRAAEIGFADQSHMSHEFVSITNRSPRSFAEALSDIEHGKLIN